MPTYIYRDTENGEEFEYKQSMNDKPLQFWPEDVPGYNPDRPRPVARKVGGGTGFILKGSGWYKTDYANSGSTISDSNSSTSQSSDTANTPSSSTESVSKSADTTKPTTD